VIYQFYLLFSGRKRIKLERHHLIIDLKVIGRLLKLSFGGMGQSVVMTSSWIALVRIIALFGPAAIAGYTIGIRLVVFALLPSLGISNAAATLVGQNLGAQKAERAEQSVWTTGRINLFLMSVIGLIFVTWPGFFIGLFIDDTDVIMKGMECLRIISYGFMAYGLGMVLVSSFNGAGDTSTPMKINIFCYWLLEIPLAYLLAIPLHMKEQGVFYAILIAEIMMTVTSYIIFRRGMWMLKRV
jgi:Na+-driven multidrug efflux pump